MKLQLKLFKVVSIGAILTFKVIFTPLGMLNVPRVPPSSFLLRRHYLFVPSKKTPPICIFVIVLVNVDIYGLSALRSKKGRANMLQTLVLLEKYNTNIDNV